jgi:peptide methionine sulfoxide reductase msrA/msrB
MANFRLSRLVLGWTLLLAGFSCGGQEKQTVPTDNKNKTPMKLNTLSPDETRVIVNKGTEAPFTGKWYKHTEKGSYLCRHCDLPLYESNRKFDAGCGWPSFDDAIPGAVHEQTDPDGSRTEITCARCGGHLGHVFRGEGFTRKNTRHCVNSLSLDFAKESPALTETTDTAIFASGCFWGTQYFFDKQLGVLSTETGYTGGKTENPSYQQVCMGNTGHVEAVRVVFNPQKTDFETLARIFFETHDFTQIGGQGPDIGEQYRSVLFYRTQEQEKIGSLLIKQLEEKGFRVATKLEKAPIFYQAEQYHQDYYLKKTGKPYCHAYKKVF